ncbi:E3 ubiquitin-protein ligase Arkadia [Acrasis kona]|uniref:RING-type E3 ubiquitin transferase n=1 Tax=Acrasis kona TaxID=1008807 RepID=A0AAW2YTW1_9EUKA
MNQLQQYRQEQARRYQNEHNQHISTPSRTLREPEQHIQLESRQSTEQTNEEALTDEEYARRLQAEFDRENELLSAEQQPTPQQRLEDQLSEIRQIQSQRRRLEQPQNPFGLFNAPNNIQYPEEDEDEEETGMFNPLHYFLGRPRRSHPDLDPPTFEDEFFPFGTPNPFFVPRNPNGPQIFIRREYGDEGAGGDDLGSYEEILQLQERMGFVNKGASQDQIEGTSIKFKIENLEQVPQDNKECMICFDEFKEQDEVRRLPCLHLFHVPCIDKWLLSNSTCPICKTDVKEMPNQQ